VEILCATKLALFGANNYGQRINATVESEFSISKKQQALQGGASVVYLGL
jgi:hypothetical protein